MLADADAVLGFQVFIGILESLALADGVVDQDDVPLPGGAGLLGNYPNPFNPTTTIVYRVEQTMDVRLEIYDASGRRVRRLVNGSRPGPARYEVVWNGCNDDGRGVASGVYYVQLVTPGGRQTLSVALLK